MSHDKLFGTFRCWELVSDSMIRGMKATSLRPKRRSVRTGRRLPHGIEETPTELYI